MMQMRVPTPCVGLCSTTYGDSVCRGCKRFAHEIVDWNRYDDQQKSAVLSRLTQLMLGVVGRYLLVTDVRRLQDALDSHSLRYRKDQPPECWAYDLFRQTRGQFARLADLGLSKNPEAEALSYGEIWNAMNSEYLAVSEGHYERYFRQPLAFD
jgi:predicted Fe-S protein YdhL (DUF1289 family)